MRMRWGWAVLLLMGLGCGVQTTSPPSSDMSVNRAPADMATIKLDMASVQPTLVRIQGMQFSPAMVNIQPGGKVRWTNGSNLVHTVTSGKSSMVADGPGAFFDENPLAIGESFEFTFTTVGTQPYFCRFHEAMGMTGTVNVMPGTL